jgi:hypothetical protein
MMRMVLMLLLCSLTFYVGAQTVSSKGMATVSYPSRLDPEIRQQALRQASLSAVEAHIAETSAAKARLFDEHRDEYARQIDRYVLSIVTLREDNDKKNKAYTVVVRAEINASLLTADLNANSAMNNTDSQARSLLTFVFISRMQESSRAFDPSVTRRIDTNTGAKVDDNYRESSSEGEKIGAARISTDGEKSGSHETEVSTTISETIQRSTLRQRDQVTWSVANASEVNTVMTGVFSNAGYEVVDAEYVEGDSGGKLSIERIRNEFSTGNDLGSEVLRSTVDGVRNADIPFLAYGTLDVGMQDIDPLTGNVRIAVTVTGKVLDVTGRFPRTVSAVGPVQYFGLGPDASVARTNALVQAAEKASERMVDELNVKNVH